MSVPVDVIRTAPLSSYLNSAFIKSVNKRPALLLSCLSVLVLAACGGQDSATTPGVKAQSLSAAALTDCKAQDNGSSLSDADWLAAWGTTRATGPDAPADTTVRNVIRVTASGDTIRLRFFNLSDAPIEIAAATVGKRVGVAGAAVEPGSLTPVTFACGQSKIVIPPKTESFYSDPIAYTVRNQDDLAISLHVTGTANPSEFGSAWSESFKRPDGSGNAVTDTSGADFGLIDNSSGSSPPGIPLSCNGCQVYALRDVEILSKEADGAMVFLGSSSIHGYNTTQNSYRRFPDQISVKAMKDVPEGQRKTIVNRGIGGDTLEAASASRLMRDVFETRKIHSLFVWVTNDLSSRNADQIIENYKMVIKEAHARGIHVYCPTWIPGAQSAPASFNGERAKLNDWILNSKTCDGAVDYNKVVEAPGGFTLLPQYNSGDSIHSNDAGHTEWTAITPVKDWMTMPFRPKPVNTAIPAAPASTKP